MTRISSLNLDLPESWKVATLADVTSKIGSGSTPRGGASVYVDSGPALIRSQNVYDHEFKSEGLVFLSPETALSMRKVAVESGDVLINITGDSILRTTLVPESVIPAHVNQHVAIVRSNGKVDPRFMQKWLSLPLMKELMLAYSSGGTRKAITKGHLKSFPIPIPPLKEQEAIGELLNLFDEKINLNKKIIDMLGDIFSLEFLRAVSEGDVSYIDLGELVCIVKGRSYKSSELKCSSTALVTLKSVERNGGYRVSGLKPYVGSFSPDQVVNSGDIVVALTDLTQDAEVVGRGVRVPGSIKYERLVASLDLAIVRPRGDMLKEYLFGLLSSESFRQHCRSHVTGTTVLHLAKDAISSWKAPILPLSDQIRFAQLARDLLDRMDALTNENIVLESLRYTLLPELLTGRVRIHLNKVVI